MRTEPRPKSRKKEDTLFIIKSIFLFKLCTIPQLHTMTGLAVLWQSVIMHNLTAMYNDSISSLAAVCNFHPSSVQFR